MGTNKNLFAYALTFAYPELMTGNFTISQSDNLAYVVQRLWEHENAITVAETSGSTDTRPSDTSTRR